MEAAPAYQEEEEEEEGPPEQDDGADADASYVAAEQEAEAAIEELEKAAQEAEAGIAPAAAGEGAQKPLSAAERGVLEHFRVVGSGNSTPVESGGGGAGR